MIPELDDRRSALRVAAALALGAAVSLGLARFSYALMLAPMRADLGWSYLTAGAMNTVNAGGYLVGALLAPRWLARFDARAALLAGSAAAALLLAAHGAASDDAVLYLLRLATGVASAAAFVSGGLLAARLAATHPRSSGLTLGIYYGGTGLGIVAFFVLLGAGVVASSWLWAGLLQRCRGGEALALLNGLLALATVLPVLGAHPLLVYASGLLFGGVFLSVVASTTSLVRHNLPATLWPGGISAFTIVFAAGQIIGPSVVGWIADGSGGLQRGLACSALALALGAALAWRQKPLRAAAVTGSARP